MKTFMVCQAVFILFIMFLLSGPGVSAQDDTTLTGIVQAVDWNENDEVIAVSVVVTDTEMNADGEEEAYNIEYFVENDENGQNLLTLVGQQVKVTGEIKMDEDGNYSIHIKKYQVID